MFIIFDDLWILGNGRVFFPADDNDDDDDNDNDEGSDATDDPPKGSCT